MATHCLYCNEPLRGRADKKFCDASCRNSYNNEKNSDANNLVRNINNKLRKNRRILKDLIPENEDKKKFPKSFLENKGFDFNYFTQLYTTRKEKQYFFIYEYGYLDFGDGWVLVVKRT